MRVIEVKLGNLREIKKNNGEKGRFNEVTCVSRARSKTHLTVN